MSFVPVVIRDISGQSKSLGREKDIEFTPPTRRVREGSLYYDTVYRTVHETTRLKAWEGAIVRDHISGETFILHKELRRTLIRFRHLSIPSGAEHC